MVLVVEVKDLVEQRLAGGVGAGVDGAVHVVGDAPSRREGVGRRVPYGAEEAQLEAAPTVTERAVGRDRGEEVVDGPERARDPLQVLAIGADRQGGDERNRAAVAAGHPLRRKRLDDVAVRVEERARDRSGARIGREPPREGDARRAGRGRRIGYRGGRPGEG